MSAAVSRICMKTAPREGILSERRGVKKGKKVYRAQAVCEQVPLEEASVKGRDW